VDSERYRESLEPEPAIADIYPMMVQAYPGHPDDRLGQQQRNEQKRYAVAQSSQKHSPSEQTSRQQRYQY